MTQISVLKAAIAGTAMLVAIVPRTTVGADVDTTTENVSDEQARFFEERIRPLLAANCYKCHGPDKQEGGLRLDSQEAILTGGDSGPAIDPDNPAQSLLAEAVLYAPDAPVQMPPSGKLNPVQIADVTKWVSMGIPWPGSRPGGAPSQSPDDIEGFTAEQKQFWAFQPATRPGLPDVRDAAWPTSPLDYFVLAKLEEQGLAPAPPADKRTLIRRATYDLIGLPPTPDEIKDFLADNSPLAFNRVVDRLLAAPHYGERWGRRWLDVARYADSNGMDENLAYGNAFRYRDSVIASFNADKPFDQFLREQIAGDLMPVPDDPATTHERLIATGFLLLGPKMLAEDDPVKMQMDIIDEQIDAIGQAFMGLTLGCARCHDHKFDPIPTADYYSLAGIFKSTRAMEHYNVVARWQELPLAGPEAIAKRDEHQQKIDALKTEIGKLTDEAAKAPLTKTLTELEALLPVLPAAMAVSEGKAENVRVHIRGNHLTLGDETPRQFPRIMAGQHQAPIDSAHSGRLELAGWLSAKDHPLTARVAVNRVWLGHFGEGLVRSPDNFGRLGERPTHPDLLDWLATEFVRSGWSLKALHRTIMLSSTYQMSAEYNPAAAAVDPENRLLWRMNRRRLEAEAIRDAILSVGGSLEQTMVGSLLPTENRKYVTSTANVDPVAYATNRRSVYLPVVRSALYDVFQAFDFADPSTLTGKRESTTVAPQALFMMNSQIVADQTRTFTQRLLSRSDLDDAGRIRVAYELAYGRPPREDELAECLGYLDQYTQAASSQSLTAELTARAADENPNRQPAVGPDTTDIREQSWQSLLRALLAANEFVHID